MSETVITVFAIPMIDCKGVQYGVTITPDVRPILHEHEETIAVQGGYEPLRGIEVARVIAELVAWKIGERNESERA